jgi:hypothetical protein
MKEAAGELAEAQKQAAEDALEKVRLTEEGKRQLVDNALGAISANLKEGSKAAKAVAVAQATIDTYRAATAAFASTAANPISVAFPAAPFLAAASAVAMGIANVRKILAVQPGSTSTPSASGGGGGQMPSFGSPQVQQTPQMNLNNGIGQNAGGDRMRERVIVVDYHDIQDKGNELQMSQQKVTLA